jgi:hypothetical protein
VELRELIHPQWAPGAVAVHALFTHGPLHVREVEAHLGRSFPKASDQSFSFIVDP